MTERPEEFEWDEAKARRNLAKHGVPFDRATAVFLDENRTDVEDIRRAYGEERRVVTASVQGLVHVVVYTMRGNVCRIISARLANRKERRNYDRQV
jgi:uncharacterized DUF497 family protein